MTTSPYAPKFSQLVLAEFGTFPLKAIIYIGAVSVAAEGLGLLLWKQDLSGLAYAAVVVIAFAWFGALYTAASMMLEARPSLWGFGKFLLTGLVMAAPLGLALLLIIVGVKTSITATYLSGGLLLLGGMVLIALLAAWPITQAVSRRWVGPIIALRATKGHRGGLIYVALILGALNRLIPSIDTTASFTAACVMAVVGAIGSVAWAMTFVSISVASSKLMSRNLAANQLGQSKTRAN